MFKKAMIMLLMVMGLSMVAGGSVHAESISKAHNEAKVMASKMSINYTDGIKVEPDQNGTYIIHGMIKGVANKKVYLVDDFVSYHLATKTDKDGNFTFQISKKSEDYPEFGPDSGTDDLSQGYKQDVVGKKMFITTDTTTLKYIKKVNRQDGIGPNDFIKYVSHGKRVNLVPSQDELASLKDRWSAYESSLDSEIDSEIDAEDAENVKSDLAAAVKPAVKNFDDVYLLANEGKVKVTVKGQFDVAPYTANVEIKGDDINQDVAKRATLDVLSAIKGIDYSKFSNIKISYVDTDLVNTTTGEDADDLAVLWYDFDKTGLDSLVNLKNVDPETLPDTATNWHELNEDK